MHPTLNFFKVLKNQTIYNLHLCRGLLSDDFEIFSLTIKILTLVVIFQYIISRLETPEELKDSLQKNTSDKNRSLKTSITYMKWVEGLIQQDH